MNVLSLLPILTVTLAAAAQEPGEVLAEFVLQGRPAYVTRTDVALEMGFHLRRRDEGRQAVDILVDSELTRRAAQRKGLLPTDKEVRAYWDELAGKFRAAGKRPEDFAAVRNGSMEQLFEYLAVQIAQERLVRKELGLGANEHVSGDMLKLWLSEERRRAKVVTDPDELPVGVACRVDDVSVSIDHLGKLLLRTCDEHELTSFVQQVAYLQAIEAMARDHGLAVTDADLDRAIAARRAEAARDPKMRGLGLEQLLKSQGFTIESLRQLRVFRAQVLLPMLSQKLQPDAALQQRLRDDRGSVLEEVGPQRRLGLIFVRALEQPNALVPRDFPAAMHHLEAIRTRIAVDDFQKVARLESEDPSSRERGGDTGWHNRRDTSLPEVVLAAAFATAEGDVSQPLRDKDGCYLVKVLEIEPELDEVMLLRRLRERHANELKAQVLRGIELQPVRSEARK